MRTFARRIALCALICLTTSCNKPPRPSTATATKPFVPPDPSMAASVMGRVTFAGNPPTPQRIDMSQDPACEAQSAFDESVVVTDGDLANVFVYVKDGLTDRSFTPPPSPAIIEQKDCRYQPHVLGVMVGQPIHIVNDDNTSHNIHPMPKESRQWNESQLPQAAPIEKRFDHPEIMIPIQCNQHPWMHMYLNVVSNPFFATTDAKGQFSITGLPPGTYTVAAIHEKLGEQDMKITVGPKESKTANLTFKTN